MRQTQIGTAVLTYSPGGCPFLRRTVKAALSLAPALR
jgi:hypothetical protein